MDNVQEIKTRLDIVEVVRSYLKLDKAGANFKGLCPFHSEKTSSFFVSPTKQMWYCFGCNRGGDMFAFVQAIDNLDFPEALKMLADRAGVQLKRENPQLRSQRLRLFDLVEAATVYFQNQLKQNEQAVEYLKKRGLNQETIEQFRLGWAPEDWRSLLDYLRQKGFKEADTIAAGVTVQSVQAGSSGKVFDRFRGRVIFPVFDHSGRPVGFAGRILKDSDKEPKYLNTPNTLIYDKGRILFGFHDSKQAVREQNSAVLVEGNLDFLLSYQAGVKNVVASSGTALTNHHLMVLRRLCSTLLTAFDMDWAGQEATKRGIDLALAQGFSVKVIQLENGAKDAADLVVQSPEKWKAAVAQASPVMEYYFARARTQYEPTAVEGKKAIGAFLLPEIKRLSSKIEKAHWISRLSQLLQIKEQALEEEMNAVKSETEGTASLSEASPIQKEAAQKSKLELLLERAVFLLALSAEKVGKIGLLQDIVLPKSLAAQVLMKLPKGSLEQTEQEFVNYVTFKHEVLGLPDDHEKELEFCLRSIAQHLLREELQSLSWRLKSAEQQGDSGQLAALTAYFNEKSKKLAELLK